MRTQVLQRYCPKCGDRSPIERTMLTLGFGGWLLAIATLGTWIFIRALFHTPHSRCLRCGAESDT